MTDTSQLLPNSVAVSSDCLYNLKPSAVRSRSYRASVLPTNGTSFPANGLAICYIPGGRRNTYLDTTQTYIRYTIKNNDGTNNAIIDSLGSCVINRLDIFHGSNMIETIQQYNVLYNYVMDFNTNVAQRIGLAATYGIDVTGERVGYSLGVGGSITVCMPILSGTIGLGVDKMLPLGMLSDDIRLEFTFEQVNAALYYAVAAPLAGYTITSFELELCIVELSDEGENMVREMTPPENPIYIHGNSWRHYTSAYTAAAGGYSTLIPARFASLKTLVLCPRRGTDNVANSCTISSRVNPNIASYWWRIGASIVPNKMVYLENNNTTAGFAEGFMEIQRSWHSLNSASNSSCIPSVYYNNRDSAIDTTPCVQAKAVGAQTYQNGFCIAQELESFAQRNDLLLSGLNTLSSQVFFEMNVNTAATNCTAFVFDFYANYDHILIIENGIISARF
jgi:hypothetical protein